MAKSTRIKDIAELAGVSAGTVDRVLHGRGKVSKESRNAVEKVLKDLEYTPNLHLSSISIKKCFRLAVTIPLFKPGEYWEQVRTGILRAIKEYSFIDIDCHFLYYDQFNLFSCREVFDELAAQEWDCVIIGPTFKDETIALAAALDASCTPYAFVDAMIEGTSPIGFFSANQQVGGYLIAKLLYQTTAPDSDYALFQTQRIGDESAYNTRLRKEGFSRFFEERGMASRVKSLSISLERSAENDAAIRKFFSDYPLVKGGASLSSRGGTVTKHLKANDINNINVVSFDLTRDNIEGLTRDQLSFVICQHPAQQGFSALKALMMKIVFNQAIQKDNYMPLDIVTKENLQYYSDLAMY